MVKTELEIMALADHKLRVAELFCETGFYDDAYYLGGYVFELLLKAQICKTLRITDFFDFENAKSRRLPSGKPKRQREIGDGLYKPFKVHDYEQLMILSGLYREFAIDLQRVQRI